MKNHSWFWLGSFVLVCCDVDEVKPVIGCESIAECPLDQICDPDTSTCVPEPNRRFLGAFSCEVFAEDEEAPFAPNSEVLGNIGDDRWTLPLGGICQLKDSGALIITLGRVVGDEALVLSIGPDSVEAGGEVELTDMHTAGRDWALFADLGSNRGIAYSSGGFVEFYDDIELGELIEAYLDVRVVSAIEEEVLLGVRCPRGDVDCGYSTDGRSPLCIEHDLDDSETLSICTQFCEGDVDCGFAGGQCFLGFCALACETDDDCPGSYCFSSSEGAFCF